MAGAMFSGVRPIENNIVKNTLFHVIEDLKSYGASLVTPIGSTLKRNVVNDIDVACEHTNPIELVKQLLDSYGAENVKKTPNGVSMRYPTMSNIGPMKGYVQVDVIIGNVRFLKWSRFAPSDDESSSEYSPVKGCIRNLLLNQFLLHLSRQTFPVWTPDYRHRYLIDFDKGLFQACQTMLGKKKRLKSWKTVQSYMLSNNPEMIVGVLIGPNVKSNDVLTFESLVDTLKRPSQFNTVSHIDVLGDLLTQLEEFSMSSSGMFNGNPETTISYIKGML